MSDEVGMDDDQKLRCFVFTHMEEIEGETSAEFVRRCDDAMKWIKEGTLPGPKGKLGVVK